MRVTERDEMLSRQCQPETADRLSTLGYMETIKQGKEASKDSSRSVLPLVLGHLTIRCRVAVEQSLPHQSRQIGGSEVKFANHVFERCREGDAFRRDAYAELPVQLFQGVHSDSKFPGGALNERQEVSSLNSDPDGPTAGNAGQKVLILKCHNSGELT